MEQRQPDPFFEQFKADIQEGIDQAERGKLVDAEAVWKEIQSHIDEIDRANLR
ncbi:MAG: hypothetical protein ACLPYS_20385 [Vulcanimicrobiaceae bacterium]|jgi:predicted transcriptional regulator